MLLSRDSQTPSAISLTDRTLVYWQLGGLELEELALPSGGFWSEEGVSGCSFHPGADGETKAGKELMLSLREMRHS